MKELSLPSHTQEKGKSGTFHFTLSQERGTSRSLLRKHMSLKLGERESQQTLAWQPKWRDKNILAVLVAGVNGRLLLS